MCRWRESHHICYQQKTESLACSYPSGDPVPLVIEGRIIGTRPLGTPRAGRLDRVRDGDPYVAVKRYALDRQQRKDLPVSRTHTHIVWNISPSLSNSWKTVCTTYGSSVWPVEMQTALWNSSVNGTKLSMGVLAQRETKATTPKRKKTNKHSAVKCMLVLICCLVISGQNIQRLTYSNRFKLALNMTEHLKL